MVFTLFHLRVFHVKIVASLWLIGWLNCFFEYILAHKEGNVIFRILVFDSLSQQSGIRAWSIEVFFFLCAKMEDDMIKLNSLNYSTWKRMMED